MLYHLLVPLAKDHIVFNVFRYLTFRSLLAMITALVISLVVGPWIIRRLGEAQQGGETIREDTPERHRYVWVVLLATASFGAIGILDDVTKLRRRKGISARTKLALQIVLSLAVLQIVYWQPPGNHWAPVLAIPFLKGWLVDLGWLWI